MKPERRIRLAKQAVCDGRRRRELLAERWAGGEPVRVGYVFIGGSFAAQNVLANAPESVRSRSLIVDAGQPGVLMGSDDVGQDWHLVFTGHFPFTDEALAKVWSAPNDFGTKADTQPNTSRLSLAYTRALNEIVLGVPVLPCEAVITGLSEEEVTVECTLADGDSTKGGSKVTIEAVRGVVVTGGLGRPRALKPCDDEGCQISVRDAELLKQVSATGLPYLFNEWQLFSGLRSETVNFHSKTLLVFGSGAAAASAITDMLNPAHLDKDKRPQKIYVLGESDRLDDPAGFAPHLYTRARLAAKCSLLSPEGLIEDREALIEERRKRCAGVDYTDTRNYELDYFDLEWVETHHTHASVERLEHNGRVTLVATLPPEAGGRQIKGDALMTAIANASMVDGLFSAEIDDPPIQFEPARCGPEPGHACQLEWVEPRKLEEYELDESGAPVALIAQGLTRPRFVLTGAGSTNLSKNGFKPDTATDEPASEWHEMLTAYNNTLEDDYALLMSGGAANVNSAALLSQGWLTMAAGKQLVNWLGSAEEVPVTEMYRSDWTTAGK